MGLALVTLLAVGALIATDDGDLTTIVSCGVLGQGRGWVPAERVAFEGDFVGFKYKGHTNNLIDAHVYALNAFELHILYAMRDSLRAVRPQGTVVDVGANVGTHSMFMSQHASKVVAVEPWPEAVLRLEEHLKINNISNVLIRPVGYSDNTATLPYHIPPEFNQGWGTFSKTYASDKYSGKEQGVIELPLLRGDDDLESTDLEGVGLIKVDIEGYEKSAFHGLKKTMDRDRPAVIFELNCLPEEGFKSEQDLLQAFPSDYAFFEIKTRKGMVWKLPHGLMICATPEGEYELVPYDMSFSDDGRNVLALPREALASHPAL
jgi:FkbM family methyltransferase